MMVRGRTLRLPGIMVKDPRFVSQVDSPSCQSSLVAGLRTTVSEEKLLTFREMSEETRPVDYRQAGRHQDSAQDVRMAETIA
jgi:hypothetical protein